MGRAPCCDQMGLKKGPWTKEEDHILISYINQHGHENWRALPNQAGLLRCGKSCRLRWTNYLRPDIKRGNFSKEEEDTIIQLHQALGNRWSAIAARLPGRTDNEIKNLWNTHLKKRLQQRLISSETKQEQEEDRDCSKLWSSGSNISALEQCSSPDSSSAVGSGLSATATTVPDSSSTLMLDLDLDLDLWADKINDDYDSYRYGPRPMFTVSQGLLGLDHDFGPNSSSSTQDDMDFWCDICSRI